ncbi:MAG: dihydrofolate reductase [Bacteroidaceae bacterium]|nr:dihydrofolate reductase [Bacteroidaceae bacterium]
MLSIICALAENHAIGFENRLLFRLSADLKRFKDLTTGHTIIMGRKTFESLPKGALPNRRNIVLSRNKDITFPNTEIFDSLAAALEHCNTEEHVFIIGGESVYAEALPLAHRLYLTHVHATPDAADAFFPEFCTSDWCIENEEHHEADEKNECPYTFTDYIRK